MRDEMLKRLDAVMAYQARKVADEWGPFDDERPEALIRGWAELRAELEAERCEHCEYFVPFTLAKPMGVCRDLDDLRVAPDFCCSDFTKKEPPK